MGPGGTHEMARGGFFGRKSMVGPPSEVLEILPCKNLIFGHFQVWI